MKKAQQLARRQERVEGTLNTMTGIELRDFVGNGLRVPRNDKTMCWYIHLDTGNQSLRDIFYRIANDVIKTYDGSYLFDNMLICQEKFPYWTTVLNKMHEDFNEAGAKLVLIGTENYFKFKFE